MSSVQAKFAFAIFAGVLASLPLSTVFDGAARAADDCLLEPSGQTPQGKHWHYRIERGTGRHCWYVRGEDEPTRSAATDQTTPAKTPSRNADMLAPRSIADARAEWPARPAAGPDVTAPPQPSAGATSALPPTAAQAQAAGPWPDPPRVAPSLGTPPETTPVAAEQQSQSATVPVPVPPPAAMPTERNMGSLQKLLLVAFGALLLSGLTGSAVYRLAGARRRARMRKNRWPRRKPAQISGDVAMEPWAPPEIDRIALEHVPARKVAEIDDVKSGMDDVEPEDAGEPVERIEDFLARLTRQLEAEIGVLPPARQRAAH